MDHHCRFHFHSRFQRAVAVCCGLSFWVIFCILYPWVPCDLCCTTSPFDLVFLLVSYSSAYCNRWQNGRDCHICCMWNSMQDIFVADGCDRIDGTFFATSQHYWWVCVFVRVLLFVHFRLYMLRRFVRVPECLSAESFFLCLRDLIVHTVCSL